MVKTKDLYQLSPATQRGYEAFIVFILNRVKLGHVTSHLHERVRFSASIPPNKLLT